MNQAMTDMLRESFEKELVALCKRMTQSGFVPRISTKPMPSLAMGNYDLDVTVLPHPVLYRQEGWK